ncbi:NAD-dependent epimerase/dehydratase family protein [Amphibiibacter pelophylacis]|uniref:NAD(P)-dependent oxidoreductase n=1 Tax=Amphibiibacter pelophylacis TaxID=1799477 RepID=A0ACC6P1E8_9BURK
MSIIALSGAEGQIGQILAARLPLLGYTVRPGVFREYSLPEGLQPSAVGDLRDAAVVDTLLEGVHALIHLAGTSVERPLTELIDNNLLALVQIYEGARRHGVRRIVFASSNHAVGMHGVGRYLRPGCDFRPDGWYGLSKMWGEGIGRMYWDKHGVETVAVRIGSCLAQPTEFRHLSTWLSHDDFVRLMDCAVQAPDVGFQVVWGISANTRSYWDNSEAARAIGYWPQDNAETYAADLLLQPNPLDPVAQRYQGGSFVTQDIRP